MADRPSGGWGSPVWLAVQFAAAALLAVVLGISAGTESYLTTGIILGGAAVLLSSLDWRRHLIPIIFAYVCAEGFVSLMFRGVAAALLLKDFLIILAYMSFLMEIVASRQRVRVRGVLIPMGVIGLLGIAQIFNPALPNLLVGLVGFKILCFYMPLVFLGYYCFRDLAAVRRFLLLLLGISVPVAAVAMWQYAVGPEALDIMGSGFAIARVQTQGSEYGSHLRAIGTFASPGMLAWYAMSTIVVGVVVVGSARARRERFLAAACLFLAVLTLLVSGTRGGFVITAVIVSGMLFVGGRARYLLGGVVLVVGAVTAISMLLGEGVLGRLLTFGDVGMVWDRFAMPFEATGRALQRAPMGWGLGYASVGARHVMPGGQPLLFVENYYAKIAYELGWFGLATFIWLSVACAWHGVRGYRQCASREARWITACLGVFLAGVLMLSFIGTALDKIPLNVFFWFFLGLMLKIPEMKDDERVAGSLGETPRRPGPAVLKPGPAAPLHGAPPPCPLQ